MPGRESKLPQATGKGARESSTGKQRELHCGKKTGTSLFSMDFPWPEHEQGCTVQHRSPKEQTLKAQQGPEACFRHHQQA